MVYYQTTIQLAVFVALTLTLTFGDSVNAVQSTYRAAVVEFAPKTDGPTELDNWQVNFKEMLRFIQEAASQKAQIVVFPEYGLHGWVLEEMPHLSTEIPDPEERILLCTAPETHHYSSTLKNLSCAAQDNNIYVVVNLIEKEVNILNKKSVYYNTNVVFNRYGQVVTRYRKMNLYNEEYYGMGKELITFTTDFNVTFGMFICFDLMFGMPSEEVLLGYNVTDIIFSTAWIAYLPFYNALTVHHSYSLINGVNLLASGLSEPIKTSGGSGIYLANGTIAEAYMSGTPISRLIVQDVPRVSARRFNNACSLKQPAISHKWGTDAIKGDIRGFQTTKQDMSPYTYKSLDLSQHSEIVETVCSGSSDFCCTFNITTTRIHNLQSTYSYKLVAYQGELWISRTRKIGQRNCGIVACLSDDIETCGNRTQAPPQGIRFDHISISTSVDSTGVRYHPATLIHDLKPFSDFTFCVIDSGDDRVEVNMTTSDPHEDLLTFGISARVFKYDNAALNAVGNNSY